MPKDLAQARRSRERIPVPKLKLVLATAAFVFAACGSDDQTQPSSPSGDPDAGIPSSPTGSVEGAAEAGAAAPNSPRQPAAGSDAGPGASPSHALDSGMNRDLGSLPAGADGGAPATTSPPDAADGFPALNPLASLDAGPDSFGFPSDPFKPIWEPSETDVLSTDEGIVLVSGIGGIRYRSTEPLYFKQDGDSCVVRAAESGKTWTFMGSASVWVNQVEVFHDGKCLVTMTKPA
ncbi:MAG: hypothetical protein RL385_907 [Pseudomonadota bacterium]|jgi:hypothetical protein